MALSGEERPVLLCIWPGRQIAGSVVAAPCASLRPPPAACSFCGVLVCRAGSVPRTHARRLSYHDVTSLRQNLNQRQVGRCPAERPRLHVRKTVTAKLRSHLNIHVFGQNQIRVGDREILS
eukprot:6190478-Pleurochrysis_carterae.AAC.3